ncbi:hypothetical protein BH24ACI3_BH24ACI3_06090 [soil metagenome]
MSRIFTAFKWFIIRGKESQDFLSAAWIRLLLDHASASKKRLWALRILALSPHYFLDRKDPKYAGLSNDEYLEATFASLTESRERIYQKILKPYLGPNDVVIDYGAGPGFLARATAPHVNKIYAVDISKGAVACAKIVNPHESIEYLVADQDGLDTIPDGQIDAVYSFAVIQHLTDQTFVHVLDTCRQKLKPNGRLILHIQLTDEIWTTEAEWKAGTSLKDKIKYDYGLHCFGRTE